MPIYDPQTIIDIRDMNEYAKKKFYIEQYEIDSLNEIRRMVTARSYKSKTIAYQHLAFLEKLADKLQDAIRMESQQGEKNWILKKDLEKVRRAFERLYVIIDDMEMSRR